jgi:glycerol-3-phosphate acyltransferase PlsY
VALGIALGAWLLVVAISRYVSVASIVAALVLPFGAWWYGYSTRMIIVAAAISALAIYKHRTNMQRLFNGTENRIGKKKEAGL